MLASGNCLSPDISIITETLDWAYFCSRIEANVTKVCIQFVSCFYFESSDQKCCFWDSFVARCYSSSAILSLVYNKL